MEKSFYYTTDLEVATALHSVGYSVHMNVNDPKRVTFYFDKSEIPNTNLDALVQSFWDGSLHGSYRDFVTNRKLLLSRVKGHQLGE